MAPSNDTSPFFSECLDHVRWVSACIVLIGHTRNSFFIPFHKVNNPNIFEYIFYGITNLQNEAVLCFFVISGYLIGGKLLSYYQNGHIPIAKYITDRLVRLYIVLIPSLGLTFIAQSNGFCHREDTAETFVGILFFIQHILTSKLNCNMPIWSLANEFWYYTLGLLVVLFFLKSRALATVGLLICISLLLFDDLNQEHVLLYFLAWAAGVGLFWSNTLRRLDPGIFITGGFFLLALAASRSHIVDNLFLLRDALTTLGIFWFLLSLRNLQSANIAPRFGRFMASFSFSLYLTHWSVLEINFGILSARNLHPDNIQAALTFIALCITCLIFAYGFSVLTERNTNLFRAATNKILFKER